MNKVTQPINLHFNRAIQNAESHALTGVSILVTRRRQQRIDQNRRHFKHLIIVTAPWKYLMCLI